MPRPYAFICLAVLLALAVPCKAVAGDVSDRSFRVPGHGTLVLRMPEAWRDQLIPPSNGMPPTINLLPPKDGAFSILITPFGRGSEPIADFGTPAMVRALTEDAAHWASFHSAETELEILPIGGDATGFYYSATDRSLVGKTPTPGEYLYVTQGQVMAGDLLCNFTLLTNDAKSSLVTSALRMLREAVHQPGS